MKRLLGGLLAGLALAALPGAACAGGLGGELTGGKASGQWGGELGVGYGLDVGPIVIRPIAGAFVHGGDSGCGGGRDCGGATANFYGKVEATFAIPAIAEVGVGARYMREKVRPYGLIALPIAPKLKVAAQVGDRYLSAGIRLGF